MASISLAMAAAALCSVLAIASGAECPTEKGYIETGGRCLMVNTKAIPFKTAKKNCDKDGGHLFDISAPNDTNVLIAALKMLPEFDSTPEHTFWVGAEDVGRDNNFVWSNGQELSDDDSLWSFGFPHHEAKNKRRPGTGSDCIHGYLGKYYNNMYLTGIKILDHMCKKDADMDGYVCQIDI